jgi:AcrR family transcriptional regulator
LAPRAYNNETRLQLQAELKDRIAAAAAELHAEKGVMATGYAEIAQRAGVSLPTVYKHFPSQVQLVAACSGHVAELAPILPADEILGATSLAATTELLVQAMDRRHAHFEPWKVWREHRLVPPLGEIHASERQQLTMLIGQVLARAGAGEHRELAAVWESLLDFELWHRLVRGHRLSRASVRHTLIQLLLAAAGPRQCASPPSPRPSRKATK